MDVAYISYSTELLLWARNDGDATFTVMPTIAASINSGYDLRAVDIDGDTLIDLIAIESAASSQRLYVFHNTGSGFKVTFLPNSRGHACALMCRRCCAQRVVDLPADGGWQLLGMDLNCERGAHARVAHADAPLPAALMRVVHRCLQSMA
jgi:hypothetical protein